MKPQIFIGSSTEGLSAAYALQAQLESKADVTIWNQGFFRLNGNFLDDLSRGLKETDFGVFIFSPDDETKMRGETFEAARDNVLFEFGMYLGGLGKNRSFFILPRDQTRFRLPSDLLGISTVTYDGDNKNRKAALGPACFEILQAIDSHGIRQERLVCPTQEIVKNPRILCACSPQFYDLSFQADIDIIKKETKQISDSIVEMRNASSANLREIMMENQFDIIHIAAYVHPKTGDVYFSEGLRDGVFPEGERIDSIPAQAFATLIGLCKARLVILATCDSLLLAAKLAKLTNMIAATDWVDIADMLDWELSFYKCISKGISLSNSFETASALSKAPMLLLTKKDLAFVG
jgi:Predicted nucleotide-binding protein containing TIR-like domain